jgi:leucyl aminopeptidase
MEYLGPGVKKGAPVALIGKAITFDSGGISLKPADRMDEMKFDKMGGLAVLGVMLAAADLKLPLHLVGLIPSAENMPSSTATRPGDIITSLDGKTIEIGNTDAEGRIILADAIAHARLAYSPKVIIALSTLTGGVVVALGTKRAGIFMSDSAWLPRFQDASSVTGELVWPLPLDGEYLEAMQSEIAFSKNAAGREGGCCKAASFLKMWAEKTPFVHLDIVGPAWITKEFPHLESGATGFGTRLILALLQQFVEGTPVS